MPELTGTEITAIFTAISAPLLAIMARLMWLKNLREKRRDEQVAATENRRVEREDKADDLMRLFYLDAGPALKEYKEQIKTLIEEREKVRDEKHAEAGRYQAELSKAILEYEDRITTIVKEYERKLHALDVQRLTEIGELKLAQEAIHQELIAKIGQLQIELKKCQDVALRPS